MDLVNLFEEDDEGEMKGIPARGEEDLDGLRAPPCDPDPGAGEGRLADREELPLHAGKLRIGHLSTPAKRS